MNNSTWKIGSWLYLIYVLLSFGWGIPLSLLYCCLSFKLAKGEVLQIHKVNTGIVVGEQNKKITVEKRWSKRNLGIFPVTILHRWSIVSCSDIFSRMPFWKINKKSCSTQKSYISLHFSEALKHVHLHSVTIFISEVIIQPWSDFSKVLFISNTISLGWNRWKVWLTLGQVLSEGQLIFYQTQRAVGCPDFRNASDRLEGSKNPWKFWCRESCDVWIINIYIWYIYIYLCVCHIPLQLNKPKEQTPGSRKLINP